MSETTELTKQNKQEIKFEFDKLNGLGLTKQEKYKVEKLLEELLELKPSDLCEWNIRAHTLLVFIAIRNPAAFCEAYK